MGQPQQEAFNSAKNSLSSLPTLTHYSSNQPLVVSCDASSYGIGIVLAHPKDGSMQPIAFASRTLSIAEKNYAQVDREGLAIIFAVPKFCQYLLGRLFEIGTDHKPLIYLFSSTRATSQMASARVQRWALILSAYDYTIVHKAGRDNQVADALSRLPLLDTPADVPLPGESVLLLQYLQESPITSAQVRVWTNKDSILSQVRNFVYNGWPMSVGEELQPYFRRRHELSILDDCLLWGSRIIIPPAGQSCVLDELHVHDTHPGDTVFVHNVRNKTLAWLQSIIVSQAGPLSYKIKLDNACIISHHVDHIRYRSSLNSDCDDSFDTIAPPRDNSSTASNPAGPSRSVESSPHQESPTIPRRSSRVRRPPDRYSPSQGRSVVT